MEETSRKTIVPAGQPFAGQSAAMMDLEFKKYLLMQQEEQVTKRKQQLLILVLEVF